MGPITTRNEMTFTTIIRCCWPDQAKLSETAKSDAAMWRNKPLILDSVPMQNNAVPDSGGSGGTV